MSKRDKNKGREDRDDQTFQVTDRRFWVEDEDAVDEAQPPEKKFPSFIEELKVRTELAESRLKEKLESLEQDNQSLRLRLQRDQEQRLEREKLRLLSSFLEIADNLERALEAAESTSFEALREGVELNHQLLHQKLAALGLEPVEPLGEAFDPEVAEAVAMISVDDPKLDQTVVSVLQRGYRKGEHLLRPAQVHVGRYED